MMMQSAHTSAAATGRVAKWLAAGYKADIWHPWTARSAAIPFKATEKAIGNGEAKAAAELGIATGLGGQNSVADLVHSSLGEISIKDMTSDSCTLGVEGQHRMRQILRETAQPFVGWCLKYKSRCEFAGSMAAALQAAHGSARTSIMDGIDRCELCCSNLDKLDVLLEELKAKAAAVGATGSLASEYVHDIVDSLKGKSLKERLDDCVREEATTMTLIIVHEVKGWLVVGETAGVTCPRITRGAPRIEYSARHS